MIDSYGDVIFSNFTNPYTGIKNCQTSATNCMIKSGIDFELGKIELDSNTSKLLIFRASSVKNFLDVNSAKFSDSGTVSFGFSNKKLNQLLENSTIYTFCN